MPEHLRSNTRYLRPPKPVWVNLAEVYPLRERPAGSPTTDWTFRPPAGLVHMWSVTITGQAAGFVVFTIPTPAGTCECAAQWVFDTALSPR